MTCSRTVPTSSRLYRKNGETTVPLRLDKPGGEGIWSYNDWISYPSSDAQSVTCQSKSESLQDGPDIGAERLRANLGEQEHADVGLGCGHKAIERRLAEMPPNAWLGSSNRLTVETILQISARWLRRRATVSPTLHAPEHVSYVRTLEQLHMERPRLFRKVVHQSRRVSK